MHICGMTVSSVQAKDIAPSVFVFGTRTRLKAFFLISRVVCVQLFSMPRHRSSLESCEMFCQ